MKKICFRFLVKKVVVIALLLLPLIFNSCGASIDESLLHGKWQATSMQENGEPKAFDLSETGFTFSTQGGYEYTSNVNYREQGTYFVDGKFLVSQDTLNEATKKSVWIEYLSADSMLLKMNSSGTPQYLGLKKVN